MKLEDRPDGELLEAARAGDGRALDLLLRRYQPRVYRFGMRMCGNSEDARDVLQETLLAMARGLGGYRSAASLSTWLYAIARSFCIKHRRRRASSPELRPLDDVRPDETPVDAAGGPEEALLAGQIKQALEQAIGDLAPMYREVLLLRDVEGLSAREVARVIGVRVDAVKSRLHRARAAVRDQVAPRLGIVAGAARAKGRCPDILRLYSKNLEGDVTPALCAEMERHLASCPSCRATCDSMRRTLQLCKAAPTPRVPDDVRAELRRALRQALSAGS